MTHLEQALCWWVKHNSDCLIPTRHFYLLRDEGLIQFGKPGGFMHWELSAKGRQVIAERLGMEEVPPAAGGGRE